MKFQILNLNMAYAVLVIALLSCFIFTNRKISFTVFITAVLLGVISNKLNYLALISIIMLGTLIYSFYQQKNTVFVKSFLFLAISVLTILAFMHKLPGYNNWQVYSGIKLSENSSPFSFWLNFDSPLIAFFLLLFAYRPVSKYLEYKEIFIKTFSFFIVLAPILSIFGLLLGYISYDPKIPSLDIILLWMIKMLFFTSLAEELFFRFFIQNNLILALRKFKYGQAIGLVIASLAFAFFLHYSSGIAFVFLAFISGLFYGGVYLRTGYLESAVLLHFLVNLIHFFFFTYPHLIIK